MNNNDLTPYSKEGRGIAIFLLTCFVIVTVLLIMSL
jgi:hypothetical protein